MENTKLTFLSFSIVYFYNRQSIATFIAFFLDRKVPKPCRLQDFNRKALGKLSIRKINETWELVQIGWGGVWQYMTVDNKNIKKSTT